MDKDELTKKAYKEVEEIITGQIKDLKVYMEQTFVPKPKFILISSVLFFMAALALGIRVCEVFRLFPLGVLAGWN